MAAAVRARVDQGQIGVELNCESQLSDWAGITIPANNINPNFNTFIENQDIMN